MEDAARLLTRDVARRSPSLRLIEGKMVAEFAVGAHGKGDAIAAFMLEQPFAGRRPVYFGDDVTDEDAYPVVDAAGGVSVRIGPGSTLAAHRLDSVDALEDWLAGLLHAWEHG
jgi:trehalose 6-phosphate phosphatase